MVVGRALQGARGTELTVADAVAALRAWRPSQLPGRIQGEQLLDTLADHTGLLRFEGALVRPWHRSFQEYLAACAVGAQEGAVAEVQSGLDRELRDPTWEGVFRFVVGVLGDRGDGLAQAWVDALLARAQAAPPAERGRWLGLAVAALADYAEHFQGHAWRGQPVADAVPAEVIERFVAEGRRWPLVDRRLALDAVGVVGDPRIKDPRTDADLWVWIPGGRFVMGGDADAPGSVPAHEVDVAPFGMSWRLVTVQDYARFLEGGAYEDPRWWAGLGPEGREGRVPFDAPRDWSQQRFRPNHPVWGVSWWEATAFCRWASTAWFLRDGYVVALPTEAQWEFAARGPAGRVYPWGHEEPGEGDAARANYDEVSIHMTSAVGAFPTGAPPDPARARLRDLAGNLWEWCRDAWVDNDVDNWRQASAAEQPGSAASLRVVRGGSWSSPAQSLRCAGRFRDRPSSRY